jgi:hypothetical protein
MRSLQVYYPDPVTGVLIMGFPTSKPASITGSQLLLQNIVLFLRTRPGSDAYNTARGSVLGDTMTMAKALNDDNQLRVLITDAVAQCQSFIIDQQQTQQNNGITLAPEETLESLEVNDVYRGDDPTVIYVQILVTTAGSQQFIVTV